MGLGRCRTVNLIPAHTSNSWSHIQNDDGIGNIRYLLLPVPRPRLSVTLAIRGAVSGIRVGNSRWRGDSAAWRRGESWAGLVP